MTATIQTLGSVQGLRYSLVRYWLASGWLVIRSATGSQVELLAGPERDIAQVADASSGDGRSRSGTSTGHGVLIASSHSR